jgi:hypothetical protein
MKKKIIPSSSNRDFNKSSLTLHDKQSAREITANIGVIALQTLFRTTVYVGPQDLVGLGVNRVDETERNH